MPQPLAAGTEQGHRVDAEVPVEEAILVGEYGVDIAWRHLFQTHRMPPDVAGVRKST